ncbi:hypothetical protein ALC57_15875 [Trachymyrmex cornetzi]|uniref:Uncharacterized protein n=1 Tax=Trachymyrmex cornetzi TaxID=471704 RepID=A0A151IW04_9HYME|nr:hypothetical protein ALC57_15875 [Trachymyrmex cornetzi]
MSCQRFQFQNQNQVGAALVAFGEAISELLRSLVQRDLPIEACSAVLKVSKGAKILADFGTSFSEEIKKASLMEKSSKNLIKTPLTG